MFNFFSLGWAVTLASIQGIIQKKGVFLRTPKSKSGARTWQAIRVTQWESLIGLICVSSGVLSFTVHPTIRTLFLGSLLLWQASLYLAAPVYSLLSKKGDLSQAQPAERGAPVLEHWAARWALGLAAILVVAVGLYQLLPGPRQAPAYTRYQPMEEVPSGRLFGFERVPLQDRALPPTLTPTPTPTEANRGHPAPTPSLTPTATLTATKTTRDTPTVTTTPVITPTTVISGTPGLTPNPTPTLESTPTPTPGGTPGLTPIPTQTGTPAITPTPTPIRRPPQRQVERRLERSRPFLNLYPPQRAQPRSHLFRLIPPRQFRHPPDFNAVNIGSCPS
jgi:hypothetical protein